MHLCKLHIILFLDTYNAFCTLGDFDGLHLEALWDCIALMSCMQILGLVKGLKAGLRSLFLNKLCPFLRIFFLLTLSFLSASSGELSFISSPAALEFSMKTLLP